MSPLRLTLVALCTLGPAAASLADPVKTLTFIEVRSGATTYGRGILRQYASTLLHHPSPPRVLVLQEIARPQRFLLLETDADAQALAGLEGESRTVLAPLHAYLIAPLDHRSHHDLAGTLTSAPARDPHMAGSL